MVGCGFGLFWLTLGRWVLVDMTFELHLSSWSDWQLRLWCRDGGEQRCTASLLSAVPAADLASGADLADCSNAVPAADSGQQ